MSRVDALPLVSERKWRLFPTNVRTLHKIELKGGMRGLPL